MAHRPTPRGGRAVWDQNAWRAAKVPGRDRGSPGLAPGAWREGHLTWIMVADVWLWMEAMAEIKDQSTASEFEALLAPILDRAFRVAYSLSRSRDEAEDLVQEAALQAFAAFGQFQRGTNFRAWYMRILTNCFFARYRKMKRAPRTIAIEDAEPIFLARQVMMNGLVPDPEDPAAVVLGKLGAEQVTDAIAALPEEFRVVCALHFVEEASYQEIADVVGRPVGTVRSRLHRGRRMLQKALWLVAQEYGLVPGPAAREEAR